MVEQLHFDFGTSAPKNPPPEVPEGETPGISDAVSHILDKPNAPLELTLREKARKKLDDLLDVAEEASDREAISFAEAFNSNLQDPEWSEVRDQLGIRDYKSYELFIRLFS